MQGVYTLHASIPEGLARPTILPDHSHPHRARMPPPLGGARRQHTHRAHTNPTCKGPVRRPSLSPRHPHRQVRLHSRRGPATLARRGPRHTHGQPGDPAGRGGGAGRDGLGGGRPLPRRPGRPPSCLPRPPGTCDQRDPWGAPRAGLSKTEQPPPPGVRSHPPPWGLGARPARLGTSGAHGCGGGGVCGRRAAAGLSGRDGRAAPQPRCLAAAGGSRAQRSAAAARLRAEHASGEGGAANSPLRSPARP